VAVNIKITSRDSDNFGDPIKHLVDYVWEINANPHENIIRFDFSDVKFINPFTLGGLASFISHLKSQGKTISITDHQFFKSYLDTLYFPDGYTATIKDLENIEAKLLPYHRKTYIPIVSFPATKNDEHNKIREKVLSTVNSIFKTQLKLSGNVLQGIFYLVDELTQNVADHSTGDKGFLVAQYFPTKNFMDVCIADCGCGLMQSYLNSGKFSPVTHEEAIRLALNRESSKQEPDSRGYGLATSRNLLVNGLKGKFFLWTGNAFMYQNISKIEVVSLPRSFHWQGCFVVLRIPTFTNEKFDIYNFLE